MTWGGWYWLIVFLFLCFGGWVGYTRPLPERWPVGGWCLMALLLFVIIGIQLFGGPVKG